MENGESYQPVDNLRSEYKDIQKEVVDSIKVKPISEVNVPYFQEVLSENKDFYGLKIYTPDKRLPEHKVYFRQNKNNIAIVQDMLKLKNNGLLITSSNIVDMNSGMVFNVNDLITLERNSSEYGRTSILYTTNLLKSSEFVTGKTGGSITWNENELQRKAIDLKFGKGVGGVGSFLSLFHEFGHRFQFKNSEDGWNKQLSAKELQKKSLLSKKDDESLIKGKQLIEEEEKNAWDFSLSVMEKLKGLGLDLSRGLDHKQIENGIEFVLSTYDKALKKIPGNEISDKKIETKEKFTAE